MQVGQFAVRGAIDKETRCEHYHSEKDIIAIKFYCCGQYFPCYFCHKQYGCGGHAIWPRECFGEHAILCGVCKKELTIRDYLNGGHNCPSCGVSFNDGCMLHHHLYFAKDG